MSMQKMIVAEIQVDSGKPWISCPCCSSRIDIPDVRISQLADKVLSCPECIEPLGWDSEDRGFISLITASQVGQTRRVLRFRPKKTA